MSVAKCLRRDSSYLRRLHPGRCHIRILHNIWANSLPYPGHGYCRNHKNAYANPNFISGSEVSTGEYNRQLAMPSHYLSNSWNCCTHFFTSCNVRLRLLSRGLEGKRLYSINNTHNTPGEMRSNELNRETGTSIDKNTGEHCLIELLCEVNRTKSIPHGSNHGEKVSDATFGGTTRKVNRKVSSSGRKEKVKGNKDKHDCNQQKMVNGKAKSVEGKVSTHAAGSRSYRNSHNNNTEVLVDSTTRKVNRKVSSSGRKEKVKGNKDKHDCNQQKMANGKAKSVEGKVSTHAAGSRSNSNSHNNNTEVLVDSKSSMPFSDESTGCRALAPLWPPFQKSVLVVESSTKAKIIQKYLGDMFDVLPSNGHVRDLAGRSGSVRPDEGFSMVWEVPTSAWTHLQEIKVALSRAHNLILATDPDREGETIAWHLIEMLHQQEALSENINISRVTFHEITDKAIKDALLSPRDLDLNLVNAYLARRALDYLIGFSISPLLWRKLPGCQSAGRVQSAALSIICDREMEIDHFKSQEYWTIEADLSKPDTSFNSRAAFVSQLLDLDSKRLDQLHISNQAVAESIGKRFKDGNFSVLKSTESKQKKHPPMPYITSTLQQDSSNKLQLTAEQTMRLAQKLYEGVVLSDGQETGLITYTRTDSIHVSDSASKDIQAFVRRRYGDGFSPRNIRKFLVKAKNAQEAQEAIRPTCIERLPSTLVGILDDDCLKLYALIWTRTMACQMEAAVDDLVEVQIGNARGDMVLRSVASRPAFLGFQAVYKDSEAAFFSNGGNNDNDHELFELLTSLKEGEPLQLENVRLNQHCTEPPARYSEGLLVKKLEELGIGRPSTYAAIIKVLQERGCIKKVKGILHPEFRGRMVSSFLSEYFLEVSAYSFTANVENELDNVSTGMTDWKVLLKDYWSRFKKYCDLASNIHIPQLEKMLEKKFEQSLFSSLPISSRACPGCPDGTLVFKISKCGTGYFIGCDRHPACKYVAKTVSTENRDDDLEDAPPSPDNFPQPKLLGHHPSTNEKVFFKKGPFGFYVQLGDDRKECPPKRASLSETKDIDSFSLEDALDLLRYPIKLGDHPKDEHPVLLTHSKHGYCIRHRNTTAQVPKGKDPKMITLEAGLALLSGTRLKHIGRPPKE